MLGGAEDDIYVLPPEDGAKLMLLFIKLFSDISFLEFDCFPVTIFY